MMKRHILAVFMALFIVAAFVGCNIGSSTSQESSSLSDSSYASIDTSNTNPLTVDTSGAKLRDITLENKTIRLYTMETLESMSSSDDVPSAYDLFVDVYGGKVEIEPIVSWDTYYEKLNMLYMSENMPDVIWPMSETYPQDIANQLIQPVDPYIELDSPLWASTRALNETLSWRGKHYIALLDNGIPSMLYFNPVLFDENGLDSPLDYYERDEWNWNTLLELAQALTYDDIWGFGCEGDEFIDSTGITQVEIKDGKPINNIRCQEIADAANFLRDFGAAKYNAFSPVPSYNLSKAFVAGKVAMFAGEWWESTGTLKDLWLKGQVDFVPFPKYPGADIYYYGGNIWCHTIGANAKNPEGAGLYLDCLKYVRTDAFAKEYNTNKYQWLINVGGTEKQVARYTEMVNTNVAILPTWYGWYGQGSNRGIWYLQDTPWSTLLEQFLPPVEKHMKELEAKLDKVG